MRTRSTWVAVAGAVLMVPMLAQAAQVSCTPSTGYANCLRFTYDGADQAFTVPTGVTALFVKAWGAGGGGNGKTATTAPVTVAPWYGSGGAGGFVSGTVAVTPAQALSVVVGQGGSGDDVIKPIARQVYGFGGRATENIWRLPSFSRGQGGDGGGLSGLFTGAAAVAATDSARAFLVAGGGGAGDYGSGFTYSGYALARGGQGGDAYSGGASSMQGLDGAAGVYGGPGGGGYVGGTSHTRLVATSAVSVRLSVVTKMGEGGSNFVGGSGVSGGVSQYTSDSTVNNAVSAYANASFLPPMTTDEHYSSGIGVGSRAASGAGGNGELIIQWNVAASGTSGTSSGVTTVPTLQFWSLLLLASVMAGLGMAAWRQRVF